MEMQMPKQRHIVPGNNGNNQDFRTIPNLPKPQSHFKISCTSLLSVPIIYSKSEPAEPEGIVFCVPTTRELVYVCQLQ